MDLMQMTKEVRRLAFRSQFLILTVAVFSASLVLLILQYIVFPGERSFTTLSSTLVPIMWVFFVAFLAIRAKKNLNQR